MKAYTKMPALACGNEGLCDVCYCQREFVRVFLSLFLWRPCSFCSFICMFPSHPVQGIDVWLAYIFIFSRLPPFLLGVVLVQGQSMSEGQRPKASPVRSRTCIFSWHRWHLANLTSNKPPPTDGILSHRHSNSKSHHLSFLPQTLATRLSFASSLRITIVDFFPLPFSTEN